VAIVENKGISSHEPYVKTEKPYVKRVLWGSSQHYFHIWLKTGKGRVFSLIGDDCGFRFLCIFASTERRTELVVGCDSAFGLVVGLRKKEERERWIPFW
jgi:hypothetical protein